MNDGGVTLIGAILGIVFGVWLAQSCAKMDKRVPIKSIRANVSL